MSDPYKSYREQAIAAFRFIVKIDGTAQAAFTECTLPVIEWEMEEVKEGGLNTYTHQLPGRRKSARLTLKNGIGEKNLLDWYVKGMSESFDRKSVEITLLDEKGIPIATWTVAKALPVKWTGPSLKPDDNTIAIQSLEFVAGEVTMQNG